MIFEAFGYKLVITPDRFKLIDINERTFRHKYMSRRRVCTRASAFRKMFVDIEQNNRTNVLPMDIYKDLCL